MSVTSGNEPLMPPSTPGRHFQFTLAEALGLSILIGMLLCIRHNGMVAAAASWQGDVWLVSMVLIGAAVGEWRSSRRGYLGWRRAKNIALAIMLALALNAVTTGVVYHNCCRCGAVRVEKYGLFSHVVHWDTSQRIENLCGATCDHSHWRFQTSYSMFLIADGFPSRDVPVLFNGYTFHSSELGIVDALEKIPNASWRLKIVDAMGDPDNRLKCIAFSVVQDMYWKEPKTQSDWDAWWQANAVVFEIEHNLAKALPTAQATVNRLGVNRSRDTDWTIKRDLPGIVLP